MTRPERGQPGRHLRAFAAYWCCAETMAAVIDPLIADLQHEHAVALRAGHVRRRWMLRSAAGVAFLRVLAICVLADARPSRWSTENRTIVVRSLAASAAVIAGVTALFAVPPILQFRPPQAFRWLTVLMLIPQALPIALTVGTALGILIGARGRGLARRVSAALIVAALAVSAGSFVNMGWIVPSANQAFRVGISGNKDVPRGVPELTLGEIRDQLWLVDHGPRPLQVPYGSVPPFRANLDGYARGLEFHYYSRWALSCSPLVFALFAISAAGASSRRWVLGLAVCAAFLGYYWLAYGGRSLALTGDMAAAVAAWLPNAVVVVFAALLALRSSAATYDGAR